MPAEQKMLHVAALQEGAVYCVRAHTVLNTQLHSSSTDTQCVSITGTFHHFFIIKVILTREDMTSLFRNVVKCCYFLKLPHFSFFFLLTNMSIFILSYFLIFLKHNLLICAVSHFKKHSLSRNSITQQGKIWGGNKWNKEFISGENVIIFELL